MTDTTGSPVLRLAQVLSFLANHLEAGLTAEELAHLCGSTPELITEDLEIASAVFPVWDETPDEKRMEAAAKCWYLQNHNYLLPAIEFLPDEALVLLTCLEANECPFSSAIIAKLCQSIFPSVREKLLYRQEKVLIKGEKPLFDATQSETKIMELLSTIAEQQELRVCYRKTCGQVSSRNVDPLGLVYCWHTTAWYLVAYDSFQQDYRTFRVDRITSFTPTGRGANKHPEFNLQTYFASAWGIERDAAPTPVQVRFYDDFNVLTRLRKETAGRPEAKLEEQPDGSVLYTDRVSGLNEFRVWLRSFGDSAEVLAPASLREELLESVERILARYGV